MIEELKKSGREVERKSWLEVTLDKKGAGVGLDIWVYVSLNVT